MKTETQKLQAVKELMAVWTKKIKEAQGQDCEFNLGGNGYNCCEAGGAILKIFEEIKKAIK